MAGSLNKVLLIGNCGKDPEVRSLTSGDKVASFSLATSETWKDRSGERKERTEWHKVTVFNEHLVKVVESYVRKGSKLYVEGQLQTRKWQDQSGADRYTTEIVLQKFGGTLTLLDSKSESQGGGDVGQGRGFDEARPREEFSADLDDEIPFATCWSIR